MISTMYFGLLTAFAFSLALHSSEASHHEKLTISPSGGEVIHFVNDSHIVTCDSHKKDVKVQWLTPKGEVVGYEKGRLHIEKKEKGQLALVFEQISLADKGEWTCTTEDGEGTKKFKMVVNQPISFMDTAIVQTAKEGKDATIRCEVKGDPEPLVSWSFNGVVISLSHPKFTKLADGLLIKRVSKNDSGEYTCRAFQVSETTSNVEEQTIRLNIQHKPTAPQRKAADIQYGYVGGMVNLTCEAEAEPQANFTWFRHGKKVNSKYYNIYTGNHTSLLQIFVNDSAQFGEYKCKAANMLGSIERIITLQEGTKPFPPIQVTLRGVNSDTFDIDVLADRSNAQSDMDIIGFRFELIPDQEYLSSGGRWNKAEVKDFGYEDGATYLMTDRTPNTTYHVRVASRNLAGLSDWSDVKKFTTHAREPIMYTSQAPSVLDYAGFYKNILTIFLGNFLIVQLVSLNYSKLSLSPSKKLL